MPIDADQLRYIYDKLWVYFVDHHLLGQPALVLLGALALMVGEIAVRKWEDTAFYRVFVRRSVSSNIDVVFQLLQFLGLAFFFELIFTLGISLGIVKFAVYLTNQLSWARIALPMANPLEFVFSFFVYFLSSHFVGYWVHRLYHTSLFWNLHRFHHSAPELNFITFYRVHPGETFSRIFFFITPLTFLDVPVAIITTAFVVDIFLNYCEHSELPWSFGWLGRWLFVSPRAHQIHHSIDAEHQHTNFSNCPLWDHVFGTWYDGPKLPSAYGISTEAGPDLRYESQPVRQFLLDTLAFYREAMAGIVKLFRQSISWMRARPNSDAAMARSVATAGGTEERLGS